MTGIEFRARVPIGAGPNDAPERLGEEKISAAVDQVHDAMQLAQLEGADSFTGLMNQFNEASGSVRAQAVRDISNKLAPGAPEGAIAVAQVDAWTRERGLDPSDNHSPEAPEQNEALDPSQEKEELSGDTGSLRPEADSAIEKEQQEEEHIPPDSFAKQEHRSSEQETQEPVSTDPKSDRKEQMIAALFVDPFKLEEEKTTAPVRAN